MGTARDMRGSSEVALAKALSGEEVTLTLHKHGLSSLPANLFSDSLRHMTELVLSGNRITRVPSTIFNLLELRKLDLEDNRINELPPSGVDKLCHLESLFLGRNRLVSPKTYATWTA